jgi:hypothetical protein
MNKLFYCILLMSMVVSCSTNKKIVIQQTHATSYSHSLKDGSSFDRAIVVEEKTETKGVAVEYEWIRLHYPGYSVTTQTLSFYKNKPFDVMELEANGGIKKYIYFDISNYYGKF